MADGKLGRTRLFARSETPAKGKSFRWTGRLNSRRGRGRISADPIRIGLQIGRKRAVWCDDGLQDTRLKTRQPLILTARIADAALEPFDQLRRAHFPPDRNLLRAHLTMFHRLPGEYGQAIGDALAEVAAQTGPFEATVSGVRHLGAGVAFSIESPELQAIRAQLKARFLPWLGPQDAQTWKPHITVQNKVERAVADSLFRQLSDGFAPQTLAIEGLDLWDYLGGPWGHRSFARFGASRP